MAPVRSAMSVSTGSSLFDAFFGDFSVFLVGVDLGVGSPACDSACVGDPAASNRLARRRDSFDWVLVEERRR